MAPSAPDAVPEPATLRGSAVKWLTASDVAEMLYGAVVTAAVLAVVSAHTEAVWRMLVAGIVTLLVYWAAHVYTRTLAEALADPVQSWREHIGAAAVKELSILRGGVPTLVIFGFASAFGASVSAAADIAIWVTAFLLAGVGYLAAHVAGWRARVGSGPDNARLRSVRCADRTPQDSPALTPVTDRDAVDDRAAAMNLAGARAGVAA